MGLLSAHTTSVPLVRVRARAATTSLTPVVSGATVVFAGAAVGQVAGFVFNAVGAHSLGPARYGTLAASIALLSLASPLFTAVQTVASRETTSLVSRGQTAALPSLLRRYGLRAVLGALVLGAVVAAASGWVSQVFHLGSPLLVVIVGATIPCYMAGHLLGGVLQGMERFHRFAIESVIEGSAKAVLGILAVAILFHSPVTGMAAVFASCACGLAAYVALTVPVLRRRPETIASPTTMFESPARVRTSPGIVRYSMTALATYGLLSLMLSMDTLVAKHYLPSHLAGLYAGISLTGKIVYFATSAMFVVAFPLFSRHHDQGQGSRRPVLASGAVVAAVSGLIIAVFALRPTWVVAPLLGARYRAADGYVSWMGAIFALYALSYLLCTYLLARRRRSVIALLAVALVIQLAGFFVFHSTIDELMGVLAVSFGVLLVGAAVLAGSATSRAVDRTGGTPGSPIDQSGVILAPSFEGHLDAGPGLASGWRARVLDEVSRAVGPVPVLLSGSRALGTARATSDCDLSVVVAMWRIPRAVPRLARASARLSADLGVKVSVNPVPRFRLARPAGSLFVDKLVAESVVVAAPPGWALARRSPSAVTAFAASSALLSAVQELLRSFHTGTMNTDANDDERRALEKVALHVAQVRLLRRGSYVSRLDDALEALAVLGGDGPDSAGALAERLAGAVTSTRVIDGFVDVRDCVLAELDSIGAAPLAVSRGKALVRNAQYASIAQLRGRRRWRFAARTRSVEADLARAQVLLLRALSPRTPGGVDVELLGRALAALPGGLGRGLVSWESARDVAVLEWADAHPLVGVLA